MSSLQHPHKEAIEALRALILGIDQRIREEIKWNAPSFAISDHFATLRLQPQNRLQLVLHTGAKRKPGLAAMTIDDADGLITWAAADRGLISFGGLADVGARAAALTAILRQWIAQIEPEGQASPAGV